MRSPLRPGELAAAVLVVAVSVLLVATRSQLDTQARAAAVLATTLETPVVGWAAGQLSDAPRVAETSVAGVPATVGRPGGGERWPALVIVNGATALGRREPALQRLARGLARAGYLCVLPDLPGLAQGRVSSGTVAAAVAVARAVARRPDVAGGRVGLVGVSVGTSLALLAAGDPSLAGAVSVVTGTAPFADLANVLRLATTGYYREGNLLVPYETDPFLAVAAARSLAAAVPGEEGRELRRLAAALDDDAEDPLAPLRAVPPDAVAPAVRPFHALLANEDPRRFDELYAALPADARAEIAALSPLAHAGGLAMPVELASARDDPYVPLAESQALARAAPDGRLTETEVLAHAVPEPSLAELRELLAFNGWVVRSLEAARG